MTSYTITGAGHLPDDTTPLVGTWYINLASGYALDAGTGFRAGEQTIVSSQGDGSASATLPGTTGDEVYLAYFQSRNRAVLLPTKGAFTFTLTANTTWDAIMDAPTTPPLTPSLVSQAQAAATSSASSATSAASSASAAAASAATAHDVSNIDTSDGVVNELLNDSGSASRGTLNAAFGAVVGINPGDDVAAKYAQLVAGGGGLLWFNAGTHTMAPLALTDSVPLWITGRNATVKPSGAGSLFKFNAGRSQSQIMGMEGILIDCTGVSGVTGVEVNDHYGAVLRDVRIVNPSVGVLITDTTGWSESSQLDNVYVKNPAVAGVDFAHTGGTGSFGYSNWGLVHVDNIPAGAVGFRFGSGCGFSSSTIARLILHSSADGAIGMQVTGDLGLNTSIKAVIEALASMPAGIALDIQPTGTLDGCAMDLWALGAWGTPINNPSSRPYQIRTIRNVMVSGSSTGPVAKSGTLGDANPKWQRTPDGKTSWGAGGASAPDVSLYRSSAQTLATDGSFTVGAALQVTGQSKFLGGLKLANATITAGTYTMTNASPAYLLVDASAGPVTIVPFASATMLGYTYKVIRMDTTTNAIKIAHNSGTINGAASDYTLGTPIGSAAEILPTATAGVLVVVPIA